MINKIEEIDFKEIKRISPSQFYSMKNCAYKSLLAEAFEKKPLLPISPNAYFGTVLHRMLELITKGSITNEDEFNVEFDKQVKIIEDELQNKGFGFLVPLKIKLKNFGLKKIQLKKHLRSEPEQPTNKTNLKFYSEKWFESKDNLIGGKIDLIVENENYVFLMISYSLYDMKETYLSRFEDVNNYANDNGYEFYCLTSSTRDDILKWEEENADNFKYCITDERTLKTIMRSNPGLLLLKDGVIINKWTGWEVSSEENLTKPLDELSYSQPADVNQQSEQDIWFVVIIFAVPLLILKMFDFLIYRKKKQPENSGEKS